MTDQPLISVVVPTHGRPQYLEQALCSLLAQTYQKWEAIVVENGAVSGAAEVVTNLDDTRLRYTYLKEGNRSLARNFGLLQARGDLVAFLDDDDCFLPDKLAAQLSVLVQQPETGLVACGAVLIDDHNHVLGDWRLWEYSPDLNFESCIAGCYLMPSVVLMRRQWFEQVANFNPELPPAEDTDLFLRLMLAGCRMSWIRSCLCQYRVHEGSSQGAVAKYARSRWSMIENLLQAANLPASVRAKENEIRGFYSLTSFAQCYAASEFVYGRPYLVRALGYCPELAENGGLRLAEALATAACQREYSCPYETTRSGLDKLMLDVPLSVPVVHRTMGLAARASFYRATERNDMGYLLKAFINASLHQPSWLLNRGTWSLLGHTISRTAKDRILG